MILKVTFMKKQHQTDKTCAFCVEKGKVWCKIHKHTVRKVDGYNEIDELRHADGHTLITLPFQHVLYTAAYCLTCDNGKVIIDEDQ